MGETCTSIFSRAEARAYDRHCMDALGISGIVLMQNAAEGCAAIARRMCEGRDGGVIVVCGSGQNGGDGYGVAALLARDPGAAVRPVRVLALGQPKPGTDASVMCHEARAAGVPIEPWRKDAIAEGTALIVDALFGTGLDREMTGDALAAVQWINAQRAPVLSIDLPSGMDCDTGAGRPACVHATVTATMVAPKRGFAAAPPCTGRVEVVRIGGPDPACLHGGGQSPAR